MNKKLKLPRQPEKTDWMFGLHVTHDDKLYFEDHSAEHTEDGSSFVVDHDGIKIDVDPDTASDTLFFSIEELEYFVKLAKFAREHSSGKSDEASDE